MCLRIGLVVGLALALMACGTKEKNNKNHKRLDRARITKALNKRLQDDMSRLTIIPPRNKDWPCNAHQDEGENGSIEVQVQLSYGGPASCTTPPNLMLFGCPTTQLFLDSTNTPIESRRYKYNDRGHLRSMTTHSPQRSQRFTFMYDKSGAIITGTVDANGDKMIDGNVRYEHLDGRIIRKLDANNDGVVDQQGVFEFKNRQLTSAQSSGSRSRFLYEGGRVVTRIATTKKESSRWHYRYDCHGPNAFARSKVAKVAKRLMRAKHRRDWLTVAKLHVKASNGSPQALATSIAASQSAQATEAVNKWNGKVESVRYRNSTTQPTALVPVSSLKLARVWCVELVLTHAGWSYSRFAPLRSAEFKQLAVARPSQGAKQ